MKHMAEKAKCPLKSGFLVLKCRFLGPKKLRAGHQLERQNGAKCRENTQKRTKTSARKAEKYP